MGWGALEPENLGQSVDFITLLHLLHLQAFSNGWLTRIWLKQNIELIAVFSSLGIELQKRFSWEPLQKHWKILQSTEYFPNKDFQLYLKSLDRQKIFLSKNANSGKIWFCSGKTISHTLCAQYQPGLGIKKIKTLSWSIFFGWYLINTWCILLPIIDREQMLSYDLCNKCIEPTWEMYLDPSEKYIGPPGTLATFHGSISAIGHVTRLDKEPRLSVRIAIWIFPSEEF